MKNAIKPQEYVDFNSIYKVHNSAVNYVVKYFLSEF